MTFQSAESENEMSCMSLSFSELGFYDTYGSRESEKLNKKSLSLHSDSDVTKTTIPSICQGSPLLKASSTTYSRPKKIDKSVVAIKTFQSVSWSKQHSNSSDNGRMIGFLLSPVAKVKTGIGGVYSSTSRPSWHRVTKNQPAGNDCNLSQKGLSNQIAIQNRNLIDSSSKKKKKQSNMKSSRSRFCSNCILGFIVLCFCPIFIGIICSLLFDLNEGENKIDLQSMSQEIEYSLQYQLIGQHLVIDAIKGDFKLSLVNSSVKSAILLLVGPSGSGKSFTRKILEGAFHEHGFKIVQRFNDASPVNLGWCESSPLLEENSNIVFVFEDADRELLEVMDVAHRVTASALVSKCNKVIIIIVSSVYGDETKKFMSERCLFGEQRLRINAGDLLNHLSLTVNELALTDRQEKNSKIIPFLYLPLDKEHLRICIQRQLSRRKIYKEEWEHITRKVVAQMDFYPDCEMMFSESGCKLVSSRIDYVLGNEN